MQAQLTSIEAQKNEKIELLEIFSNQHTDVLERMRQIELGLDKVISNQQEVLLKQEKNTV